MINKLYAIIFPPCTVISTHKISSEAEIDKLFEMAVTNKHYLYSAEIENGEIVQPWKLDQRHHNSKIISPPKHPPKNQALKTVCPSESNESATQSVSSSESENNSKLKFKCPYCPAVLSSGSGRTLHLKSKHKGEIK